MAGDDLRFIDWNTYARLDKLFLKMFLEEDDLHFYALIDASGSMDFGTPTKLEYAKQLAAALGFIGLVRGDRVKIETLGQSPRPGPCARPQKFVADDGLSVRSAAGRNGLAGARREEFLFAKQRQRDSALDHRL